MGEASHWPARFVDTRLTKHHDATVRTTLDINDALLREMRLRAEQAGRPFRSVVEETIALGLARQADVREPGRRFRVKAHPLHLKPGFRAASLNQIYDQIEAEDAVR